MKPKTAVKFGVDILMTLALLFVMGYQFWGDMAHEWVGTGMFMLFISHHILNLHWYKHIFKVRHTPMRTLTLCVDIFVMLSMLALMYSGIVISNYVFVFLPIEHGITLAHHLHTLGAYWGFILMSAHLGLHWNMVIGMVKKRAKLKPSKTRSIVLFCISIVIAVYGIYVLISRDFASCLFLKNEFVFLNYNESIWSFYIDYLAIMGLCIFIAHCGSKLCSRKRALSS